jgi:hypothetical protein
VRGARLRAPPPHHVRPRMGRKGALGFSAAFWAHVR